MSASASCCDRCCSNAQRCHALCLRYAGHARGGATGEGEFDCVLRQAIPGGGGKRDAGLGRKVIQRHFEHRLILIEQRDRQRLAKTIWNMPLASRYASRAGSPRGYCIAVTSI